MKPGLAFPVPVPLAAQLRNSAVLGQAPVGSPGKPDGGKSGPQPTHTPVAPPPSTVPQRCLCTRGEFGPLFSGGGAARPPPFAVFRGRRRVVHPNPRSAPP
jgi:hypothetical protein